MRTLFLLLSLTLNSPTIAQPSLPADVQAKVDAQIKAGGTVEYRIRDRSAEGVGASGQATGDKTDLKVPLQGYIRAVGPGVKVDPTRTRDLVDATDAPDSAGGDAVAS